MGVGGDIRRREEVGPPIKKIKKSPPRRCASSVNHSSALVRNTMARILVVVVPRAAVCLLHSSVLSPARVGANPSANITVDMKHKT